MPIDNTAHEARATETHKLELEERKLRMKREEERHAKEMKNLDGDPEFKQAQLALLAGIAQVLPVIQQSLEVISTQYEFGSEDAIRAAACGLIKKAAMMENDPNSMRKAAEELLKIISTENRYQAIAKARKK